MRNSKAERLRRYEDAVLRQARFVAGVSPPRPNHAYVPVEEFLREGHTIKVGEDGCRYVADESDRIVFWLEEVIDGEVSLRRA